MRRLSLETIDYQYKDSFPPQLEHSVEEFYDALTSHGYKSTQDLVKRHPGVKKLEALIFDRFGMKVQFQENLHVLSPAAVIPFFGDYYRHDMKQQGFMDLFHFNGMTIIETIEKILKDRKSTLSKIHNKKGFINTKLARVGGYLSEVTHYLIIDFQWALDVGLTAKELAAIILHEVGHAFDGMEEHYRLETTNRAILDILVDLNDNKVESATYKFKKTFPKSEFDAAHLSSEKERQDFCGELARQYIGHVKSQMPSAKYDETNFENMADTFAARFGMGKHLVSALEKLMRKSGAVVDNTLTNRIIYYTIDVMLIAGLFLIVPVYGAIVFTVAMMYLCNTNNETLTYDKPIERYTRIRNTIVNSLKKLDLPKDVLKDLLEQLEYIEAIMRNSVALTPTLTLAGDTVFPDARRDTYYIDLQRAIEDSLNNRLFVQSAQLRAS